MPSVVWYEFTCGPADARQVAAMRALAGDIVPFDEALAEEASRLFNVTGRKRHLRVDAMIAATATARGIPLATSNRADFRPFTDHGLRLQD